MRALGIVAIAAGTLLIASCSGEDASTTTTTAPGQRWHYAPLTAIDTTFLGRIDPEDRAAPQGLDARGVELWDRYRDAELALDALTLASRDEEADPLVAELIASARALFVHVYSTGVADEMIAEGMDARASSVVESPSVPFEDGVPVAVRELDQGLERGCATAERDYYVWLGQTTIDEVAHRAGLFARYALDRAAAAGCDWAITELVEQALRISGLD